MDIENERTSTTQLHSPDAKQASPSQVIKTKKAHSIRDLNLNGRQVFMRLDLNVPIDAEGEVTDDTRIQQALPTIQYAIDQGAKLVLASHLGRPKSIEDRAKFTLEPVARRLAELLNRDVSLADDCVGEGIELMAGQLAKGEVLLLENLRFHNEEKNNDPNFCRHLARLCEVYVTDAFGTAHRKHASTFGLPELLEERAMGFLIEKELQFLEPLLGSPQKPFFAILGGAKVSDKILAIEALLPKLDGLFVGGAMAYAFSAALGQTLPQGARIPTQEDVDAAASILRSVDRIKKSGREFVFELPVDTIDSFDIGPKTLAKFCESLGQAKTIFWNGPVGWFEKPEYAHGTMKLAESIAQFSACKIVGGGDTVAAVKASGFEAAFDHLSTGGGAVLTFLEKGGLPGIEVLKSSWKESQSLV